MPPPPVRCCTFYGGPMDGDHHYVPVVGWSGATPLIVELNLTAAEGEGTPVAAADQPAQRVALYVRSPAVRHGHPVYVHAGMAPPPPPPTPADP